MRTIPEIARAARAAGATLLSATGAMRNRALLSMADGLRREKAAILAANGTDVAEGKMAGLSSALIDRLTLNDKRVEAMAVSVEEIAALPDPVGEVAYSTVRPDGLAIRQQRVPLGVLCVIFESRPNVVTDIAALALKSGNASILRGGKEAFHSNQALGRIVAAAVSAAGLSADAVQVLESTDRALMAELLKQKDHIDIVVPRGGEGLIRYVTENSLIPVVKHDKGVCHTFVHADADPAMATAVCVNAKAQRPGTCNAMENLLLHRNYPAAKELIQALIAAGIEVRGDDETRALDGRVKAAEPADYDTEYLDLILSVKMVGGLDEAMAFIRAHGSGHSEAILTKSFDDARRFQQEVDAACILVNASTRLADGGVFGLGAEVGISTQKLHVRGPMGVRDLTCLKYLVEGRGHLRS